MTGMKRQVMAILLLGLVCLAALGAEAQGQQPADSWTFGPTTPFAWYRFDAAYYPNDGYVYFLGGGTPTSSEPQIWRYNPVTQAFQNTGAALPQSVRNYRSDVLPDGTPDGPGIYIVAGNPEPGFALGPTQIQVYYPSTNSAVMLSTDPLPVCSDGYIIGAQAVVGNKLYVFGGWDADHVLYDETWQYDPTAPANQRWTVLDEAHLSLARTYITPAVYDGKIYAIGGDTWDGTNLIAQSLVEVFDPYNPDAGWSDAAVADLPMACDESQAFVTPDGIILAGCGQWPGQLAESIKYTAATNHWDTSFPDMNEARRNHAGVQVPNTGLWVFGGIGAGGDSSPITSSEFFPLAYTPPTYSNPPRTGTTPPPCDFDLSSISGHVIDGAGQPLRGVTLSAGPGMEATTDAAGAYTITNVPNGTYTLSPSRPCYTFSPASRGVTVPPDATGQDFTGTLPGGHLPDTGFRSNPDGYQFANWGSGVGGDFAESNLVQMFGSACVCQMQNGGCEIKNQAKEWRKKVVEELGGGRCLGMSSASLRFFTDRDAHPGFDTTYSLEKGSLVEHTIWDGNTWVAKASEHLTYHAALQFTLPLAQEIDQAMQQTPRGILSTICSQMVQEPDNPPYLVLLKTQTGPGHAVVPFAVGEAGNGVYWVSVYDNNHPADGGRFVAVDIYNDTWSYALSESTNWSGDANSHTLGAVPVEAHSAQPDCDFSYADQPQNDDPQGQVWLDGPGHLLITDSAGQRIGFLGEQYLEGMAGAFGLMPIGGLGVAAEPVYFVPLTSTQTILVDGQTLTQTKTVSVARFGPGHAVWADNVPLEPGVADLITVVQNGSLFSYKAGSAKEADLSLAFDGDASIYQLTIAGADIGTDQTASLFIDVPNGRLALSHEQNAGGQYDVSVSIVSADGEAAFAHSAITIEATDTHYFDYGSWDGSGPLILQIDHGSDGTIDEEIPLENQSISVYLPLLMRSR